MSLHFLDDAFEWNCSYSIKTQRTQTSTNIKTGIHLQFSKFAKLHAMAARSFQ